MLNLSTAGLGAPCWGQSVWDHALNKWFPPCLFNVTANCGLPGAFQSHLWLFSVMLIPCYQGWMR